MAEKKCEEKATYRYTWPGKDEAVVCVRHAREIKGVAEAMGMHLQGHLLSDQDLEMDLSCSSFVSGE